MGGRNASDLSAGHHGLWWSLARWVSVLGLAVAPATAAQGVERNGISVGRPKMFDNRTLQIMLDQLNAQLETVRVVDQQKLLLALGTQQGSEMSKVRRSVSLSTLPIPGVTTKETLVGDDSSTAGDEGELSVSERTTMQAASTPTAPPLTDLVAGPSYSPTFGSSADDLLADQVNLGYQIFNLRMLLERSLTDRLWEEEPRLQAVLGFQVSLDPPKRFRDHAAFVEITVTPNSGDEPVSLVAMMPFEKTYNSSALSTRSTDFGGSAVAKVVTVGYQESHERQTFYLFRDSDTLALEQLADPTSRSTTFGWSFRPVLGRRSVTPGVRQMLAVVALPASDDSEPSKLEVTVRTYWRRYKRSTLTTTRREKGPQAWPAAAALQILSSSTIQKRLQPVIEDVDWTATGTDSAVVTLHGKNFFPGTEIILANHRHYSPETGLILKSDRTLELRTSLNALAAADPLVSGRYGGAVSPTDRKSRDEDCDNSPSSPPKHKTVSGILLNSVSYRHEEGRKTAALAVTIRARNGKDLDRLPSDKPLLVVGGRAVPGPYLLEPETCEVPIGGKLKKRKCWILTAHVGASLLSADVVVGIRFPFRGPQWSAQLLIQRSVFSVTRSAADEVLIHGRYFTKGCKVELGKTYSIGAGLALTLLDPEGGTVLRLQVPENELRRYKQLVLISSAGKATALDIPAFESKPQAVKPVMTTADPPS